MDQSLRAFYLASLSAEGHAALYRYPSLKVIHGIASSELSTELKNKTGFIIHGFNPLDPTHLIPSEVEYEFEEKAILKCISSNEFVSKFEFYYHENLVSNDTISKSPYQEFDNPIASTHENYVNSIEFAQSLMRNNKLKKVVMSRIAWKSYSDHRDIIQIFLSLCDKYPNAFVSLLSSPTYGTWLGASPEILLHQSNTNYTTVALAGTRKSNSQIPFTKKEIEEQEIIGNYILESLNGIGINCNFKPIENFDTGELTHLKTTIQFEALASQRYELATLLHPTPAVGGFPKTKAIDFILENENYNRKLYAGYLGVVGLNEMQLFVNIRCMQWYPDSALLYSGAGITLASDANSEWEETENKLEVIGSVLLP